MYRLNVFTVTVPPLRDRPGDIDLLVTRFLQRFGSGTKTGVTAEALELLHTYDWPGNVRELQNIIQYATTVASGSQVTLKDLPERILTRRREPAPSQTFDDFMDESYVDARASFLGQFERWYARHRLEQAEGNVSHAARAAGMDRSNFRRMAKRCGVLSEDT
jgi:two-component system response regulator HydG